MMNEQRACATDTGMSEKSPLHRANLRARPLDDIHRDAVFLHAFAQGIAELHDTLKTDLSPASNSMPAMFESLIERAERLANDIEVAEYVGSRK